ncbi:MAG: archease, partial [Gemmatimonadota bacterium]|nr:archease [Gemmatimonadota bacterium]
RIEASDLRDLFHGAACGTMGLVLGTRARCGKDVVQGAHAARRVELSGSSDGGISGQGAAGGGEAAGADLLPVRWLEEILYLLEVEGFEYAAADFETIDPSGLVARIRGWESTVEAEREIKGVTYHRLHLEASKGRLVARVYFDL